MNLLGYNVVTSDLVPTVERRQVRFPRSKKVRIRRKWAKDGANFREFPVQYIWLLNRSMVLMHPSTLRRLEQAVPLRPSDIIIERTFEHGA